MWRPIRYAVVERLGFVDEANSIEVNWLCWNEGDVKLDIRRWVQQFGEEKPGRGLALTPNEARNLYLILRRLYDETGIEPPEIEMPGA